jgi:hypothetical protein
MDGDHDGALNPVEFAALCASLGYCYIITLFITFPYYFNYGPLYLYYGFITRVLPIFALSPLSPLSPPVLLSPTRHTSAMQRSAVVQCSGSGAVQWCSARCLSHKCSGEAAASPGAHRPPR